MKKNHLNLLIILLIILVSIYIIRILKITGICTLIISILSPLIFGYILSWVLKPLIDKFKFNRIISTIIIYIIFIGGLVLILMNLVPLVMEESKKIIPILKYYIYHNNIINSLYTNLNIKDMIVYHIKGMNNYVNNIFSITMNVVYSLIFCFYFLISKNNKNYFRFIPNKLKNRISKDLRLYMKSIFLDTLFMFMILFIIFKIVGLESPFIFALFCAITNIIPYLGPYIGGIPAVIIGLTKSVKFGITILFIIIIVQLIENNIVQPFIVSKNVKLNQIYILISFILFSHFLGIIGMIISTPIVLILRNFLNYYKKNKPRWFNLILDKL